MIKSGQRLFSRIGWEKRPGLTEENHPGLTGRYKAGLAETKACSHAGQKLQSKSGESIAETLVAVLIISLAMTMLAGMITTTSHLVMTSSKRMEKYYEANSALETLAVGEEITIQINKEGGQEVESIPAIQATNNELNKPVIAYRMVTGE